MKTVKKVSMLFAIGVLLIGMFFISESEAKVKIRLAHQYEASNTIHKGALLFKECVEFLSDGELEVEIYLAGQVGNERAIMESVKLGTHEIGVTSSGTMGSLHKPAAALSAPYLFRDSEHYYKVVDGPIGKALEESIRKATGIKPIGVIYQLPRHLTTKFPVKHVNDIKGLKIRVPDAPAWMEMARAWGTKPTPVPWPEIYTSLKLGVVDAQENPYKYIWTGKIYEVLKYCILTGHMHHLEYLHINDAFFSKLDPDNQKIVGIGAKMWANYTNALASYQEEYVLPKKLEQNGMKILPVDKTSFIEATKDVYKKYLDKEGQQWVEKIRNVK